MKKIRFILAVWICKLLVNILRCFNRRGTTTPAVPAFKICPEILSIIASKVKKEIIVVCGTNGKTTTNNVICSVLENKGYTVACNKVGANMLYGVIVAFVEKLNFVGKCNLDYACIEIDEASAQKVFKYFSPDYVVLTNLFRDQLDRYGEIDLTLKQLETAINMTDSTKLIINADDPFCALIAQNCGKQYFTYGIGEKTEIPISMEEIKDSQFCGVCGERLIYNYYLYGQLGDYYCPKCGFKRPDVNYRATDLNVSNTISFTFNDEHKINSNYGGFYNVYNLLAAISTASILGVDISDIEELISRYKMPVGRMEKFHLGKEVILNLSKNPIGFTNAIIAMLSDRRTKDAIVMLNDGSQDGVDISWIWDVDFEKIDNDKVKSLGLSGTRKEDLAVRFKYAQVHKGNKVYAKLKDAITNALNGDGEVVYVLVNYTAIFVAQDTLKKMEKETR